jgi:hypothetical protein
MKEDQINIFKEEVDRFRERTEALEAQLEMKQSENEHLQSIITDLQGRESEDEKCTLGFNCKI